MTTALCFNCGETKFGALCPCPNCKAPATDNIDLDIQFSDHRMSVSTLEELGRIIKIIRQHTEDSEIVFWAFISYISNHPEDILFAEPPEEISDRVASILANAGLPIIELNLVKKSTDENDGLLMKTVALSGDLFGKYALKYKFSNIDRVQVLTTDHKIYTAFLVDYTETGTPVLEISEKEPLEESDILAIRKMPGCLLGWLFKPPWIR